MQILSALCPKGLQEPCTVQVCLDLSQGTKERQVLLVPQDLIQSENRGLPPVEWCGSLGTPRGLVTGGE